MQHLDFPAKAREHGLEGCEYVNQFFKDKATDFAYLRELTTRCDDNGVKSLLIMCDGEGDLAGADEAARQTAIANHFRWIAAGAFLGCHSIRVNLYGQGTPEELAPRAADSLHRLGTLADGYGLNVIVENHGGASSIGSWLAGVMRLADHPRVGTLPDFGNFNLGDGKTYDRYKGVEEMMPFAKAVSAKSYDFDAAGNETTIDYGRMLKIVLAAGYHSYLGIEYEGERLSEPEGVEATKALLVRLRTDLSRG
jgi:sugar phosphate isomerase/epimerase